MVIIINKKQKYRYLRYGYLLLGIPLFFLLRYYYIHDPEVANGEGLFPKCFFNAATGLHCPGCGSQRATHDLLHLRIGDALKHNLMIIIIAIVLIAKGYAYLSKKYFTKYYYNLGHSSRFTIILIVIVFGYWIIRNIPVAPFHYLAP